MTPEDAAGNLRLELEASRVQYVVDRPLVLDSPQLNYALKPTFAKWRGRAIFRKDAQLVVCHAARFLTSGNTSSVDMPFPKISGLPRHFAQVLGHLLPRTVPTSKLGILEFVRRADVDFLTELSFSLGAFGAAPIPLQVDTDRFIPLVVDDAGEFDRWLSEKFNNFRGPVPRPELHIQPLYGDGPVDWVSREEVLAEMENMLVQVEGGLGGWSKIYGRRP